MQRDGNSTDGNTVRAANGQHVSGPYNGYNGGAGTSGGAYSGAQYQGPPLPAYPHPGLSFPGGVQWPAELQGVSSNPAPDPPQQVYHNAPPPPPQQAMAPDYNPPPAPPPPLDPPPGTSQNAATVSGGAVEQGTNPSPPKPARIEYTRQQKGLLEHIFRENIRNPDKSQSKIISELLSIEVEQCKIWYQNRRRIEKNPILRNKYEKFLTTIDDGLKVSVIKMLTGAQDLPPAARREHQASASTSAEGSSNVMHDATPLENMDSQGSGEVNGSFELPPELPPEDPIMRHGQEIANSDKFVNLEPKQVPTKEELAIANPPNKIAPSASAFGLQDVKSILESPTKQAGDKILGPPNPNVRTGAASVPPPNKMAPPSKPMREHVAKAKAKEANAKPLTISIPIALIRHPAGSSGSGSGSGLQAANGVPLPNQVAPPSAPPNFDNLLVNTTSHGGANGMNIPNQIAAPSAPLNFDHILANNSTSQGGAKGSNQLICGPPNGPPNGLSGLPPHNQVAPPSAPLNFDHLIPNISPAHGGSEASNNLMGYPTSVSASTTTGFSHELSNGGAAGFSNGANGVSDGANGFSNGVPNATRRFSNESTNEVSNGANGFSNDGANAFSNGLSNGGANGASNELPSTVSNYSHQAGNVFSSGSMQSLHQSLPNVSNMYDTNNQSVGTSVGTSVGLPVGLSVSIATASASNFGPGVYNMAAVAHPSAHRNPQASFYPSDPTPHNPYMNIPRPHQPSAFQYPGYHPHNTPAAGPWNPNFPSGGGHGMLWQ